MRRYILTAFMLLMLFPGFAFANGQPTQVTERSKVEKLMQLAAKQKSKEIDYAYISTGMFKQMFGMLGAEVELQRCGGVVEGGANPFASIRYMRRFQTRGETGYSLLSQVLRPFLQEDELVMGMELMTLNRENGVLTVVYSDARSVLVINDEGDELSVVFIAGLNYDIFIDMKNAGINIEFGF